MRIDILTLFPDGFELLTDSGITGRAHGLGLWSLKAWNPRDFVDDPHRTVDDRPYGGGPGMVMMAEPLARALAAARADRAASEPALNNPNVPVILLAPGGKRFDQTMAANLSQSAGAIFVCGRYEGVDQRFIDQHVDQQWSLGDFVVSGGELALLPILDAAVRLMPGAMNQQASHDQDSFQPSLSGLLDSPHYTRPEVLDGVPIPQVLKSGHHLHIAQWRREQSLAQTLECRPDLIDKARAAGQLSPADERFLKSLKSPDHPS
jgi:tRNA (guanine37-N1)-methyltransferase